MASPWRCALPASRGRTMGDERGEGVGLVVFFFFFISSPPLFFPFLSPPGKQKLYGIKATMKGSRDAECAAG